jgi:predicted membrane protein
MRNQPQVWFGVLIIVLGIVFLLGTLFSFNVWTYCWPIGLIALGVVVLIRPRTLGPHATSTAIVLGDIKRDETWKVSDEEFWAGICGLKLDLSRAEIPIGETHLRLISFIGDIDLRLPQEVGIHITSNAFISDVKLFGRKQDSFFLPNDVTSDNYATAERKIRLDTGCFIADIDVKRS